MARVIKGSTKIELTNVNTNETQIVEEDNLVTNAFSKFVNARGRFMSPAFLPNFFGSGKVSTYSSDGLFESLFGGLMLFDQPLNDNPDDFSVPPDVNCVGYATDVANSGTNLMKGTYNQHESGIQDDGSMKFVWDFTTNQANGQIGSICLVPLPFAKMGWGNKYSQWDSSLAYCGGNIDNESFCFPTLGSSSIIASDFNKIRDVADMYFFHKDNYIYGIKDGNFKYESSKHSSTGEHIGISKKLKIVKRHFPITEVSPFDASGSVSENTPSETFEIDLPDEISTYLETGMSYSSYGVHPSRFRYLCDFSDKHIYLYLGGEYSPHVAPGGSFPILKVNVDTWETEVLHITNTTTSTFYPKDNCCASLRQRGISTFAVIKGKLVMNIGGPSSSKVFIIDLADNTNVTEVMSIDGSEATFNGGLVSQGLKYKDYLFVGASQLGGGSVTVINTSTSTCFSLYCGTISSLFPYTSNNSWEYDTSLVVPYHEEENAENIHFFEMRGTSTYYLYTPKFVFGLNILSLMTKNNLASPVTKTSAQTMKITYTLSETNG